MSMETTIINDLQGLSVPVFQQGSWPGDVPLPETFITYLVVTSVDVSHYNNVPTGTEWQIQFNTYSTDPDVLDTTKADLCAELMGLGYTRDGLGFGGEFEEKTGRYSWYHNFYKFERQD